MFVEDPPVPYPNLKHDGNHCGEHFSKFQVPSSNNVGTGEFQTNLEEDHHRLS